MPVQTALSFAFSIFHTFNYAFQTTKTSTTATEKVAESWIEWSCHRLAIGLNEIRDGAVELILIYSYTMCPVVDSYCTTIKCAYIICAFNYTIFQPSFIVWHVPVYDIELHNGQCACLIFSFSFSPYIKIECTKINTELLHHHHQHHQNQFCFPST